MKNMHLPKTNYNWKIDIINKEAIKQPRRFVLAAEQLFQQEIENAVDFILEQKEKKIIMLAGPSSSGKTTTANKFVLELEERGFETTLISLDDFYLGTEKVPILEDGTRNFESVNSLNVEEIEKCICDLISVGECDMPLYDFFNMEPAAERRYIKLPKNGIAIIEGLHALNSDITKHISQNEYSKIYISVEDDVYENGKIFLSREQIRLIRRIIRDFNYRNTPPFETVLMWKNVLKSEKENIIPFAKESDFRINSLHGYEICIMQKIAIDLLSAIPGRIKEEFALDNLREKLKQVEPINKDLVPQNSLIREFI